MGVPKRKTSKSRKRMRQASHRHPLPAVERCPQCGEPKQPHRVCPSCGSYRGRKVLMVSEDE